MLRTYKENFVAVSHSNVIASLLCVLLPLNPTGGYLHQPETLFNSAVNRQLFTMLNPSQLYHERC